MTQTKILLFQQTGESRITFGIGPDAEAASSKLQENYPGRLELVAVTDCRNVRAARQVWQMLHDRYRAYQDGDWYSLPAGELSTVIVCFRAMNAAASTAKEHLYQQVTRPGNNIPARNS
jgi:hypothetical protein